jgi:4-amino-4-deoxy-L-arabinose transferase-like glycosyltransferase
VPTNRLLWGVLLLALAMRIVWGLVLPANDEIIDKLPDQREYLELGRNLLHARQLQFTDLRFGDIVYAYRTPGYPLLVAACGGNVRAVRVVQAILDTSTVLAAYLLARRWLSENKSILAALLVAVHPYLIYFTALVLSETLFSTMLAWGMALIVGRKRGCWFAGAILLALSVLVRPSAILLPVVLAIGAAVVNRGRAAAYQSRWSPPVGAALLILIGLSLLPWAYRNKNVLGRWIWTTTNTGITAYDGFNPDATGASDQSFVRSMPQLRNMSEIERSHYLGDLAAQYVRQHPQRAVLLALVKIARTWSPIPLSDEYGGNWKYVTAAMAFMVPFYLMILYGLWFGSPPTAAKVFLLLPAIYFTVAHALSVGSLRYRIPADVPMAVIAASMQFSATSARSDTDEPAPASSPDSSLP